ncbi:hypothetical protein BBAD15_g7054 [Beauveria bassiana D1-5]|uniref:Uncharacterized protein n=1 Tax=Beauveria bassiana D1-5 TaxID=1245745 RepID=A0A0A2W3T8_BEABA|nr:hypothetical protein BBAD15_g7054 [Beauveria bassiana D1-5]
MTATKAAPQIKVLWPTLTSFPLLHVPRILRCRALPPALPSNLHILIIPRHGQPPKRPRFPHPRIRRSSTHCALVALKPSFLSPDIVFDILDSRFSLLDSPYTAAAHQRWTAKANPFYSSAPATTRPRLDNERILPLFYSNLQHLATITLFFRSVTRRRIRSRRARVGLIPLRSADPPRRFWRPFRIE